MTNKILPAFIVIVLSVFSLVGCLGPKPEEMKPDPAQSTPAPSASTPVVALPVKASQLHSSSHLVAADKNDYSIGRAFDGNRSTAWCEGASGDGAGQFLEIKFEKPTRVEAIALDTGFVRMSPTEGDLFRRNAHVKKLRVHVDGSVVQTQSIGSSEQSVAIELHRSVSRVKLEFVEVWPGQADGPRRAFHDLCISEIQVFGN